MRTLSIDIESYSEVDIKFGTYKYAQKAEVLLFAYSYDHGPVNCIDLTCDWIPRPILEDLTNPDIRKTAFNANFEIWVLSAYLGIELDPAQWECTMVRAAMAGLPLSLDGASKALRLSQTKDSIGKTLIRYFCLPCKPTKANGMRTRNYPEHAPEKWAQFIQYCKQDVATEQAVAKALAWLPIPETERKMWILDQKINREGIKVNLDLVKNAMSMDEKFRDRLTKEAIEITGLANPNSVDQLKKWLAEETGLYFYHLSAEPIENTEHEEGFTLNKAAVAELMDKVSSPKAKRVLEIRAAMSKTSVKKYAAMLNCATDDSMIRGLFQYYGANRTGRFTSRLVQVQNLARISMPDDLLDMLRDMVLDGDYEGIELCFGSISECLSQLVRTNFIPTEGCSFLVVDYSAIEARNAAFVADEKWRLDVFNGHGKIYEASASQMFKVPLEAVTKGSVLRQKSKIAELALGYAGGVNALLKMGALDMGLSEDELKPLVEAWRLANPNIVKLWYALERAAKNAIQTGGIHPAAKGAHFKMVKGNLAFVMPSGRALYYHGAKVETQIFVDGKLSPPDFKMPTPIKEEDLNYIKVEKVPNIQEREVITYWGMDQTTKQWCKQTTYSGKLMENLCQAMSRDCLVQAMLNIDAAGFKIRMHVHDEVVIEIPKGSHTVKEINDLMVKKEKWMAGFPLATDGAEVNYYQK